VGYFVRSCLTWTKNVISTVQIILLATSCLACSNIRSSAHYLWYSCTLHVRTDGRPNIAAALRAHTSDPAAATFALLLRVHLFWLHSLIRVRFVIKTGILERSLTEIICAHSCSNHPHPTPHTNSKCTYSVSETDRQTSLPNTAAWWSKPIDHPISSPINHLLSFALSPTSPPSCTISPFFVPSLPTSFSLYAFAFNPWLKSRSTKRPNLYHSRHQPKTVKYSTGCFKQVVLSAAQGFVLTTGPYKQFVTILLYREVQMIRFNRVAWSCYKWVWWTYL